MKENEVSFQDKMTELREKELKAIEEIKKNADINKTPYRTRAIIHMTALGFSKKHIAQQMGLSEQRVHAILKSESAQKEVVRLQDQFFFEDPQKMFRAMVPKAARTVNRLLNQKVKESVQLGAANTVFDRALGKPIQTIEHEGSAIKELLMALDKSNRAKEEQKDNIVEAEFKEVKKEESGDDLDQWLDQNL